MWFRMSRLQREYTLSERLIRAISNWRTFGHWRDEVEKLLDEGANPNASCGTHLPLHCACMVGDDASVNLLIRRGADVNRVDGYGLAPLHYAAQRDLTCVETLIAHGADVNISDANQATALHWAAFKDDPDSAAALLEAGADVNKLDFNSDSPLSWAAKRGNMDVIEVLLDYNANPETRNKSRETPLLRAAMTQAIGLNLIEDDKALDLLLEISATSERWTYGNLPLVILRDKEISNLLHENSLNVRSLKHLSRLVIRQALARCHLPTNVLSLPLPPVLHQYILYRDLGLFSVSDSNSYEDNCSSSSSSSTDEEHEHEQATTPTKTGGDIRTTVDHLKSSLADSSSSSTTAVVGIVTTAAATAANHISSLPDDIKQSRERTAVT